MSIGNRDVIVYQVFEDVPPAIENPLLLPVVIGQLKYFAWAENVGSFSGLEDDGEGGLTAVSLPMPIVKSGETEVEGSILDEDSVKVYFDPKIRTMVGVPATSGEDTYWSISEEGDSVIFEDNVEISFQMTSRSSSAGEVGASRIYYDGADYFLEDMKANFNASGIYGDVTYGDQLTVSGIVGAEDMVITDIVSRYLVKFTASANLITLFSERPDRVFEGNGYIINRVAEVGSALLPSVDVKITASFTRTDKTGEVHFIESDSDLNDLAPFYYKNELGYGVQLLYSYGGSRMAYVTVDEMTTEKVSEALALLEDEEVYFVVPLSSDRDVNDLCLGHVNAMSDPEEKKERRLYSSMSIPDKEIKLSSGVCTIEAGNILEDLTIDFLESEVQVGDTVLILEEERTISLISSANQLKLSGTAMTPTDPGETEGYSVYQKLDTKDEQADYFQALGQSYSMRRSNILFPEELYREVTEIDERGVSSTVLTLIPSYFANCTIVGGLRMQRGVGNPFSGLNIPGFQKVPNRYFTDKQLRRIQSGGVLVAYPDESGTRAPVVMQQLTTDTSSILKQEISIQESIDMFTKYIRVNVRPFLGNRNLSPKTIEVTRIRLEALLQRAYSEEGIDGRGPVIGEGSVLESFERDQECGDCMIAKFRIQALVPFNRLYVYLYVSI